MQGVDEFKQSVEGLSREQFVEQYRNGFLLEVSPNSKLLTPFLLMDAVYNVEFPGEETDFTKTLLAEDMDSATAERIELLEHDINVYEEPEEAVKVQAALIYLISKKDTGRNEISVGRLLINDIVIPKGHISKSQAMLRLTIAGPEIRDNGSRNGTYVNGKQLAPDQWQRLSDGDDVSFSPQLVFRYFEPENLFDHLLGS